MVLSKSDKTIALFFLLVKCYPRSDPFALLELNSMKYLHHVTVKFHLDDKDLDKLQKGHCKSSKQPVRFFVKSVPEKPSRKLVYGLKEMNWTGFVLSIHCWFSSELSGCFHSIS